MLSSLSSPLKRMPSTPAVARPIGRSASSEAVKRMAWPRSEMSSRSSSPEHRRAPISESSSFKLMAIRPALRAESYSSRRDFFTLPSCVASTRYGESW